MKRALLSYNLFKIKKNLEEKNKNKNNKGKTVRRVFVSGSDM